MLDPFRLPFVQRGVAEVLLLSVAAGTFGTWFVLRGLAFYTHAVATAAFPGLVLAAGLGFAAPIGAFAAAAAFAAGMNQLSRYRQDQQDSMTALALVAALVVGVILASDVFHSASSIETLLFGSLLTTGPGDLALAAGASAVALAATTIVGGRWLAAGFDPDSSQVLGVRSRLSEGALLVLIALAVTAALATTGALLATAVFVIPAATTRMWSRRLIPWQVATVGLVAVEGIAGLWLSVRTNAPPGGTIATLAGGVFAASAVLKWLTRSNRSRRLVVAATAAGLLGAACAGGATTAGTNSLQVVATTTQIGDWVRTVGGSQIALHQILQPNTDPHEYEPRPQDVLAVAQAKVVFENGDNLDRWMDKVISESGGHPAVVVLGNGVPVKLPGEATGPEASKYDPHWWHDPVNAEEAMERIAATLARADPAGQPQFEARASAYTAKLRTLDQGIKNCVSRIPPDQRKLVTDHDAFDYFASAFGIKVVGAVIPSQTTQGEPSAGELADLIALIKEERVQAVFPESSLNPKLAQSIATATGAASSYALYGDTLGPAGSTGSTYLTMEVANSDSMARGFTGGLQTCTVPGIS